ncbi:MAG: pyruvate kinase, partial [Lachnospiraceae bacterium]|nr:pyruvate kinase [Lachnospiraceae bacterium]
CAAHKEKADLVKKLRAELDCHTALLLDTKGPEIRIKTFKNKRVELKTGDRFALYLTDCEGDENGVSITYPDLYRDISVGTKILIDDGLIELSVESFDSTKIICRIENGGAVSDRKGINIPGVRLSIPFMSERDRSDIAFGVREDFDFIAASFTQSAADVRAVRDELEKLGCHNMRIIAKIENAAGVENIDEILNEADGIMVARGDMGVEIPGEEVPIVQKMIIRKVYNAGKQVITATQMLDSMIKNPRPTRAETTDVANAIYDGTSAIMLSGETAAGMYPVEAVETMVRIAERTECDIDYRQNFFHYERKANQNITDAICHAACTTAMDLNAAAIVIVTKSGRSARNISKYRPVCNIIAGTTSDKTSRQLNMSWGVTPIHLDEQKEIFELFDNAVLAGQKQGLLATGDTVVVGAGVPLGVTGNTNMLKVQTVE